MAVLPDREGPEKDSMNSERTVGEVVDLIVELGLVDPDTLPTCLVNSRDEPLSYYEDTEQAAVLSLLLDLGIGYIFDHKAFRHINTYTDEERRQQYESELQSLAACSRGMVTIGNVRLVEGDTTWELRFDCNGATEWWPVYPGHEQENIEASLVFATYLSGLTTDLVEQFCSVDLDSYDEYLSEVIVFGDPQALGRLGAQFGLTFELPL